MIFVFFGPSDNNKCLLRFKQFAQTYHHLAKSSRPMAKMSWVIGSEMLKENEGEEVL
jgi:hypothetical protein